MFEQTFVTRQHPAAKTYSVFLSLLIQCSAIGLISLLPLIYTQVLPSSQLTRELLPSPRTQLHENNTPPKHASAVRSPMLHTRLLLAPVVIPRRINQVNDIAPPLSVGAATAAYGQNNALPGLLSGNMPAAAPQFTPAEKVQKPKGPVRIGTILESNLIYKVMPVYPPAAKAARVQGAVEFTAIISKTGTIENLRLVRGHPLLVNAAKAAVLQWKYRPTLLNGEPVEVITDITVNFVLSQ